MKYIETNINEELSQRTKAYYVYTYIYCYEIILYSRINVSIEHYYIWIFCIISIVQ